MRWVGEAVAAGRRITLSGRDAAEAVEIDYEVLPAVTDPEQAMEDGAPQLYDTVSNNVEVVWDRDHGDIDAAFADAPIVAKARIRSQRLAGVPMEARAVAATRSAHQWHNGLDIDPGAALEPQQHRRRTRSARHPGARGRSGVGGGFGVKIGAYQEDFIVAALAFKMRRPLKWIETRSENFLATIMAATSGRMWKSPPSSTAASVGCACTWCRISVVSAGHRSGGADGRMSSGCYDIPALEFRSRSVYTNKMALGAYRGAGRPEAAYYVERAIDLLADAAGSGRSATSQFHRTVRQ